MEFESSSEATESSKRVFREVSVKLEVMIFRQSVFETRKKIKSLFRPKIRPTVKELLLLQTSPRYRINEHSVLERIKTFICLLYRYFKTGTCTCKTLFSQPSTSLFIHVSR